MKTIERLPPQKIVDDAIPQVMPVVKVTQAQTIISVFVLAALFMSTSLGMGVPIFAHLLKEAPAGVRALSFMTMVPQIALFLLSPFIGCLEDRYGRRPFLLLGFAGLVVANIGYLFVHSITAYTSIRLFQAIVCVGIIPAQTGILADIVPERQRTRWMSLILAGHAGGFALGPVLGGFLLQRWGSTAPFGVSAFLNFGVFCLVWAMLPKIPSPRACYQKVRAGKILTSKRVEPLILSLLLPLLGLLVLDFVLAFGWTFVEPQQALYLYKVLKFTPIQFGLLMSSHGLTMLLGQLILSRWGDRGSRRVIIATGILCHAFFLFCLLFAHQFLLLFLISLLTGIGGGMIRPLLSVCYLDRASSHHHSSVIGIKEAVGALGGIAGSLSLVLASSWLLPQRTFLLGGCLLTGASLFALFLFCPTCLLTSWTKKSMMLVARGEGNN